MSPAVKPSAAEKTARDLRICGARIDGLIAELVASTGTGPLGISMQEFQGRWLTHGRLVDADIAVLSSRRSPRPPKRTEEARQDGTPDLARLRTIIEAISRTTDDLTLLSVAVAGLSIESAPTRELAHRIGMAVHNQSMTIGELSGILHEFVMDVSHPNLAADLKLSIEGGAAEKVHKLSPQTAIALLYELELGTQQVFKANPPVAL